MVFKFAGSARTATIRNCISGILSGFLCVLRVLYGKWFLNQEQLRFIDWMQHIFAFQLNHYRAIDYQIGPKATVELHVPINDRHRLLPFDSSTQLLQFIREARLIS